MDVPVHPDIASLACLLGSWSGTGHGEYPTIEHARRRDDRQATFDDPSIRWRVLHDLTGASADEVVTERARVEHEGWGARLLALEDDDGLWAGGSAAIRDARRSGEEYLLSRSLFRRATTGEVVDAGYLDLAFPYYWRYDVLRVLDYFRRADATPDPRMAEAVQLVRAKQQADGRWLLDRIHPGRVHFHIETPVGAPSRWNTLRALRVLDWYDRAA